MIIKNEQIEVLKHYVSNLDECIQKDDVQKLLDAVDDVIVGDILGNNDEPTETGIKLQKIYDQIFAQN